MAYITTYPFHFIGIFTLGKRLEAKGLSPLFSHSDWVIHWPSSDCQEFQPEHQEWLKDHLCVKHTLSGELQRAGWELKKCTLRENRMEKKAFGQVESLDTQSHPVVTGKAGDSLLGLAQQPCRCWAGFVLELTCQSSRGPRWAGRVTVALENWQFKVLWGCFED